MEKEKNFVEMAVEQQATGTELWETFSKISYDAKGRKQSTNIIFYDSEAPEGVDPFSFTPGTSEEKQTELLSSWREDLKARIRRELTTYYQKSPVSLPRPDPRTLQDKLSLNMWKTKEESFLLDSFKRAREVGLPVDWTSFKKEN